MPAVANNFFMSLVPVVGVGDAVRSNALRPPLCGALDILERLYRVGGYRFFWRIRFLVALTPVWDLLIGAKNLFVAAKIVWHEVPPSLRRTRG